jgi:predicted lysophospholipase L1 biosynthesis ABC-type transport system permease subunit
MMRLGLVSVVVALLGAGCVAKYLCPSGFALRQVDAELALDPVSVRTVATLSVCGLPVVVETRTDGTTATICVDAPLVGVRCKEITP